MSITNVHAIRMGKHASDYLSSQERKGRVVSTFQRGISILFDEDSDPGLVTFQQPAAPLHPWAIAARNPIWAKLNSACHLDGSAISFTSEIRIDLSSATVVELGIAPWGPNAAEHARQRIPDLHQFIKDAPTTSRSVTLDRLAREALLNLTYDRLTELIADTIGQGPGSTPSGDDYAVGQLAVQWAMQLTSERARRQLEGFQKLCQWEHLKERTPIGSAQMILAAAAGQFAEPVCDVMKTLGMHATKSFYRPTRLLILQGVTSGTATLAGILDGLKYLAC